MTTPFDAAVSDEGLAQLQAVVTHPEVLLRGREFDESDIGNAERLVHYQHGHIGYIKGNGKDSGQYVNWDDRRWNMSSEADLISIARRVVRMIALEAQLFTEDADANRRLTHARKSSAKARMESMLGVALGDESIWMRAEDFDRNPYLVNMANGTVDIRQPADTRLRDHDPLDRLTRIIEHKYNPSAQCPKWIGLVTRVVQEANESDDGQTLRFLQKLLGYSLLGLNQEHVICFLTGSARCGKSKIIEIMRAILGAEYAHQAKTTLISKNRSGHHDSETFSLVGKRFVGISEVSSAFKVDENQVKGLTGDATTSVRKLRDANERNVPTSWTIWLATNENPDIQNWDDAIAERVIVVPCGPMVPPAERVQDLDTQIIQEESEGVLAWLIEGAHMWWTDKVASMTAGEGDSGLRRPPSVHAAGLSYAMDSNIHESFVVNWVELEEGSRVSRADVWKKFEGVYGKGVSGKQKLNKLIEGLPGVTVNTAREFVGVKLKSSNTLHTVHSFDWSGMMSNLNDQ